MTAKAYSKILALLALYLLTSLGCDESESTQTQMISGSQTDAMSSLSEEERLAQQLPLETTLTTAQREEYQRVLAGIYEELNRDPSAHQADASAGADPTASCDRCGRETGFLPIPDLFLTRLIPVEMKSVTLGLASWEIDVEESELSLSELLGDEAPEELLFSYRLTLARVDIASMSEAERVEAEMGQLFESGQSDHVSLTSLNTTDNEAAISFEHGFAYVISLIATESNTKLTSEASAPLMLYCPSTDKDDTGEELVGGCLQLVMSDEVR